MKTRQVDNLDSFTRAILKHVGQNPADLPVVNDRGEQHVVTAMDDEPMSALIRRVKLAGGYANVFVHRPDRIYSISVLHPDGALSAEIGTLLQMPSKAVTSVGMFVDYLLVNPERVSLAVVQGWPTPAKGVVREKEFLPA